MSTTTTDPILLQILEKLTSIEQVVHDNKDRLTRIESSVDNHGKRILDIEKSIEFHANIVEDQKAEINKLKKTFADQNTEVLNLKIELDSCLNQIKQERIERNKQDQYFRSSFFVQLYGIALQPGEEKAGKEASNKHTLEVVRKVASHCHFEGFDTNQIDVCHRVSKNSFSPIIIKFKNKNDRARFYKQRTALKDMKTGDFGFHLSNEQATMLRSGNTSSFGRGGLHSTRGRQAQSQSANSPEPRIPYVSIFENLTKMNADLLKEARIAATHANFKYKGYSVNGEIRVKLSDGATHIAINDKSDIQKIK